MTDNVRRILLRAADMIEGGWGLIHAIGTGADEEAVADARMALADRLDTTYRGVLEWAEEPGRTKTEIMQMLRDLAEDNQGD